MDVEKQFRETHTTRPSLEEQNQELITSVSELNSAEPVSATSIQGDQAKESSAAIQKDEQPVQNVMVPFKQAIVPEDTPREPQTACKKGQLIVFDLCDFQKTFLGELWNHRNNPKMIEKKSAATTIVFGDLLPSEVKVLHVSAQQELLISDWAGRLQIYLWKPGAYDSILIIFGECSLLVLERAWMQQSNLGSCLAASFDIGAVRGSYLSNQKELSNKLNGNGNVTHQGLTSNWNQFRTSQSYLWRPESCADYMEALKHAKTKKKREKEKRFKPPNLSQERHQDSNKEDNESMNDPADGGALAIFEDWAGRLQIYLWKPGAYDSILIIFVECSTRARTSLGNKELEADQNALLLDHVKMQQSNLGSCLATSFDIGAVRGSYLSNQKELSNKINGNGNLTHQGLTSNWNQVQSLSNERVMGSTSRVILCLLCLNFSEFRTSQSYL
ncbi:hypothetical protein DY000_02061229 [Brassica cretica]|uniref:Uncharacterized protein n=1 Tax=Brassica cretica TaxID=69181 RepID=A0ABQ7AXI7_BRACR|nr:hypothetical protein DY000_02061229 [Brassica cretica]